MTTTPAPQAAARFTRGPILRHVAVMATTGGIGLMAIFLVDFLSLLYVSWLNDPTKTAAVGFASVAFFFAVSINIGFMIAVGAVVGRALGAREVARARALGGSGVALACVVAAVVAAVMMGLTGPLLGLLGARGETARIAGAFLGVSLPSNVLMAAGMAFSGVLRGAGDAKRAMYVTLGSGLATAVLDPLFIFGLRLDVMGAAYAGVLARLAFAIVGYHGAVRVHDLVSRPSLARMRADSGPILAIAGPAILTNLATPIANAFLARIISRFGDPAVAASSVIDRIVPLAFGGVFALSGAVGPILAQNWGARLYNRMGETLRLSLVICTGYVLGLWLVLLLLREEIVGVFRLGGEAAEVVRFFCYVGGPGWACIGGLFVANAAFNNLGFPYQATLFNWGRATLGTIPLAALGAHLYGPRGAIGGTLVGGGVFGLVAAFFAFRAIGRLRAKDGVPAPGGGRGAVGNPSAEPPPGPRVAIASRRGDA